MPNSSIHFYRNFAVSIMTNKTLKINKNETKIIPTHSINNRPNRSTN